MDYGYKKRAMRMGWQCTIVCACNKVRLNVRGETVQLRLLFLYLGYLTARCVELDTEQLSLPPVFNFSGDQLHCPKSRTLCNFDFAVR